MMRFFLVGTDHRSATLRLIADTVFDTRRDALAYLSSEAASSALVGLEEEVYVVDLDVATPVLIVPQQTSGGAEDEPVAEDVSDALAVAEAEGEEAAEDVGLAGALRRATGTLESEGIVAPESIGPAEDAGASAYPTPYVPEPAAWPWDPSSAEESGGEDAEVVEATEEATDDAVEEPEAEVPELALDADLEAVAESLDEEPEPEAAEQPAETAEIPEYVPDPLEEPAVEATDLVSAPADEALYGRTVVMGEYAEDDTPAVPIEPMGANGTEEADAVAEAEIVPISEAEPAAEAEDGGEAEVAAEPEDGPAAEVVEIAEAAAALDGPADDAAAVQAVAAYGCDDCVYVNTCPKHHESDPSSCGSFQWKTA